MSVFPCPCRCRTFRVRGKSCRASASLSPLRRHYCTRPAFEPIAWLGWSSANRADVGLMMSHRKVRCHGCSDCRRESQTRPSAYDNTILVVLLRVKHCCCGVETRPDACGATPGKKERLTQRRIPRSSPAQRDAHVVWRAES